MTVNVNIELTDRCNLRCRMCSQSLRPLAHGEPPRFMDWETWRRTLQGLRGMPGALLLCPHWLGEPTIHPDFDAMVEYAFVMNQGNRLFRHFKLHTNAVCFGRERAELLVRLAQDLHMAPDTFLAVHFSIDAASREVYRELKGADHFERVTENILGFLDARQRRGAHRPVAHLALVVQPENTTELRRFTERWGAALRERDRRFNISADWPDDSEDAIYLRMLNSGDQERARALHAAACEELGLLRGDHGFRARASF